MKASLVKEPLDISKMGKQKLIEMKALACEEALELKKKINKLQEKLKEKQEELTLYFTADPKQFFSELGTVKFDRSLSYSIPNDKINKVKELLQTIDADPANYITEKISYGVTALTRDELKENSELGKQIRPYIQIEERETLTIKPS